MELQGHYKPLPRTNGIDLFRLLNLERGKPEEPVVCSLRMAKTPTTNLRETHEFYEALSYEWGPEQPRAEITLDAWPFHIRHNLHTFLQRWRHPTQDRTLWVDALCIDQSNTDERADQVQLMDRIYRGARRVVVWLGQAGNDGYEAMMSIRGLAQDLVARRPLPSVDQQALSTWSHRTYWTRTWVVQEVVLSRDLLIVCGPEELEWQTIETLVRYISDASTSKPLLATESRLFAGSPAYVLLQAKYLGDDEGAALDTLLIRHRDTQCRDSRDKIYAMLALARSPPSGHQLRADYNKDLRVLLLDVIKYCGVTSDDMAKWVVFLAELLGVKSTGSSLVTTLRFNDDNNAKQWSLTGFAVGTIIHCSDLSLFSPSQRAEAYNNASTQRALRGLKTERISQMLAELGHLDTAWKLRQRPAALVVAFMSGVSPEHQEILLGTGFGTVKKGDLVAYFLGHEVGFTVDPNYCKRSQDRITGRLVCAKSEFLARRRDTLTRHVSDVYVLHDRGELAEPVKRLEMQLNPGQIFSVLDGALNQ